MYSDHLKMDAQDIKEVANRMRRELEIVDRKYRLRKYPSCFVGSDAVQWMIKSGLASDVAGAEALGDLLIDHGVFFHVTRRHMFENRRLFYRFMHDRLED
ncbi:Pleckstrin/ G-protein, interacting region [Ectocarpus siliculosus]|uniref:Pleckstrin/ G-protein, interacting region n=1 Tax=Ectocarpus siliculosus TaxID=2880 RepID=D7FIE8_ECTSI|nr:Pleckstrin/ G-protein, interacting region [Ectocarpus siliculosus]|eukprot:CBJ28771.1 Pleckstrin/ G-protein, interacting region [Ectocarpus siliculosus]